MYTQPKDNDDLKSSLAKRNHHNKTWHDFDARSNLRKKGNKINKPRPRHFEMYDDEEDD